MFKENSKELRKVKCKTSVKTSKWVPKRQLSYIKCIAQDSGWEKQYK